jgi:DNA-binding transcriptional regulator GbsR (MarR family)
MAATDASNDLERARDLGIDTCGRIAEFWGFTRTMGRAFGLLYLADKPLPQVEVQRRLGISAGSASMTLTALQRWGVVHRVWVKGSRKEHYQSETDFWKMISGVLNERERREIAGAVATVAEAELHAAAAVKAGRGSGKHDATFVQERLSRLAEICRLGETLLDMLLGQLRLDVGAFRDVFRATQGEPQGRAPAPEVRAPSPAVTTSSRRAARREPHRED